MRNGRKETANADADADAAADVGMLSTLTVPVDSILGGNVQSAAAAVVAAAAAAAAAEGQLFPIETPLILQLVQLFLMTD